MIVYFFVYKFCLFIFCFFFFFFFFFFFNDTATTEIYTLSLHDALPILEKATVWLSPELVDFNQPLVVEVNNRAISRSEEHTSELQSLAYLVCRLLLEKKKKKQKKLINKNTQTIYYLHNI